MSAFFAMGGYAAFIWPAYGFSVLIIAGMVADSLARARRWKQRAEPKPDAVGAEQPGKGRP